MKTTKALSVSAVILSVFGAGALFFSPQAYAAGALPPTQATWAGCRATDTFDACCRRFGGTSAAGVGGQSCYWESGIGKGVKGLPSVSNPQHGSGASASGDESNLPKKTPRTAAE